GRTRRWWPAVWSPTMRRNSPPSWAGRPLSCPTSCVGPLCTPTTWPRCRGLTEGAAVVLPGGGFGAGPETADVILVHLGLLFPFEDVDKVRVQAMLCQPVSTPDLVQGKAHQQGP